MTIRLFRKNQNPCDIATWPEERREKVLAALHKAGLDEKALHWKGSVDPEMDLDDDEHSVISIVGSDGVDREREVVDPRGLDLSLFAENPMVPFAHDYWNLAVGKSLWQRIKTRGGQTILLAKTKINTEIQTGKDVWNSIKGGFLRGWSIGFATMESGPPTTKEIEKRPHWRGAATVIRRAMLLEYSVAPIPMNPAALTVAISKGLSVSQDFLDEIKGEKGDVPEAARNAATLWKSGDKAGFTCPKPFASHEECVAGMEGEVDDPDAFCAAWGRHCGEEEATRAQGPENLPQWKGAGSKSCLGILSLVESGEFHGQEGTIQGRKIVWVQGKTGDYWRTCAVEFPADSWEETEARKVASRMGCRAFRPAMEKILEFGLTEEKLSAMIRSLR